MTSKFVRVLAAASLLAGGALAQTGSELPSAPSSANTTSNAAPVATGNKAATINIDGAIANCNEGMRDFDALAKKLEPKQAELKNLSEELDGMKKQLNTQSDKLTDTARGALVKQIEQKQKSFDRSVQDARDDYQNQQNEIAQRILQKMAPMMVKYAADNGFGLLLDTSKQWPEGQVIWSGQTVDITRQVVDAYNAQSGVPAPAAPKPAATTPKAPASAPKTTTPPTAPK
ncbi:MAG TPA: OmpH family outer membrane protein [Terriglobales bacterium]|jgi:outer membrane protein